MSYIVMMSTALSLIRSIETAPANKFIRTDKELLDALGLGEGEAARTLGKSRQAFYQAKLNSRADYFKITDIATLCSSVHARSPDFNFQFVLEFVRLSRGDVAANEFQRLLDKALPHTVGLEQYSDLWIVLPDISLLRSQFIDVYKELVMAASQSRRETIVFVANEQDCVLFEAELANDSHCDVRMAPWMGSLNYTIVGDPRGVADCFTLLEDGFHRSVLFSGSKAALLINTLSKRPPAPCTDYLKAV